MSSIYVGMDVHKESITAAVLPVGAAAPPRVDRLANDESALRRYLARLATDGPLHVCYEASGAGFVLQRVLTAWGYACTVIAPSLIPTKPGVQRKHDRYDAAQLARLFRAGGLQSPAATTLKVTVNGIPRCRHSEAGGSSRRESHLASCSSCQILFILSCRSVRMDQRSQIVTG